MELTDALHISLRPAGVAQALCDSTLVRASLENCDSFTKLASGEYTLTLTVPVGPLRARYDVRARVTSSDASSPDGAPAGLHWTVNFKATAAGVGALRGQVEVVLGSGASGNESGNARGNDADLDAGSLEANDTRVDYAIWATLTGPLAELPPRQIEQALHGLAEDFFAEFGAVVEAKYGRAPNRARPAGQARRRHVFLRPISLAGASRRSSQDDASDLAGHRSGAAFLGHREAVRPDRPTSQPMPLWLWAIVIAVVALVLYAFHRLQ
ncbi:SRPBCC domain-containing protein [Trinickia caryophylli]|uniref:Carbon monoxide dehydrogenase subunit G n=1 Tax=Trinickia caryophylli TaxID=28094 RepID=A0A1X7EX93_TRICW|nr:SRPBCC domain-containing protein [Trinickia caryophylli]PMS09663.1 carbon monoxide dehydrogenase [Trinickia caryophylli]TRX18431.1 carbon monoxide dehydrogenase [Trinickia caryophylli]WQE10784.1 SRPBCC domain-containing protein [Trinickia caryophylli]SMF42040.1 Carbon monoxide dehydrogenase subunit G [Trinickia caryophylli]GLU33159.1 hypothetical protein Busp01_30010 [Trinickia caryophylli]